jgi:steroid delta-isomerase-like uncharacterized protein
MSTAENKALVRRWYDEVLNGRDLAAADGIVAEDFVINGEAVGRAGLTRAAARVRSVFPDLLVTVEDVVAEGDRVVTRFTARATHRGPFMGVPPTGKSITLAAVHVDRIAGGRIAERWETVDMLAVLRQLGATVTPPTPT